MNKLQQSVDFQQSVPCLSEVFEALSEVQKCLDEVSGIAFAVEDRMSGPRPVSGGSAPAPVAVPSGKVGQLLEMAASIRGDVSRLHRAVSVIDRATS